MTLVQQILQEWRESNEEFMTRLIEASHQELVGRLLGTSTAQSVPTAPATRKPAKKAKQQTKTESADESLRDQLLARSQQAGRVIPKLTGDVRIPKVPPKKVPLIIDPEKDPTFGLQGSDCYTEKLDQPLAIPVDGESDE